VKGSGPFKQALRRSLRSAAAIPGVHRVLEVGRNEFDRALRDDWYEGNYFGDDAVEGLIGYDTYTRESSNAEVASYIVWRFFDARTTLDVGCAFGFVVEALRELGIDARGCDVSQYAIDHALAARGYLRYASLEHRLPYRRDAFDVVSAFEVLEHLPPQSIPRALAELRRVARRYVVATIPSFGPNPYGPGGWFDLKVKAERLDHYRGLGEAYTGPVPYEDLYRDAHGDPVEGHLTIASFDWWSDQFATAGFVRCGAVERRMHAQIARFGMTRYWNLYVLRQPDAPDPAPTELRSPAEIEKVEREWRLQRWKARAEDVERVRATCGPEVFDGVPLEFGDDG
jgi:SAM-dependent methyltransferase